MRFQPVKCNLMQLTRKKLNKIQASCTLEGAVLENVDNINPARMGKWVLYGQNQGMMPKLDPCGSHIGILTHVGPT